MCINNVHKSCHGFLASFIIAFHLLFLGCTVGPRYQAPSITVTNQWKNHYPSEKTPDVINWWELFNDQLLSQLIQQAIDANPDLIQATERVKRARELAKVAKSRLFPHLNLNPAYNNAGFLYRYPFGPDAPSPFITRQHQVEYALPLNLNFEVDLWAKLRNGWKAAKFTTQAEQEAYQALLLFLTTDLANAYFQLRVQDAQIELFDSLLMTRQTALKINQSRHKVQIIDYRDVAFAQEDLSKMEAQYQEAIRIRNLLENQIAVLVGSSASEFKLESMPLSSLPPTITPGTQSDMLLRRPDLAEQERRMASIHARLNVAYASYFPSIELVGGLGSISPIAHDFLKGKSRFWLIGVDISQFIFDAGERFHNVEAHWAELREATAHYRKIVLTAFQEVEDSLSNIDWISNEMDSIKDSIRSASTAYEIALARYNHGVSYYIDVVNYKKQELENKRTFLSLVGMKYLNTIQLIKAIGGGWGPPQNENVMKLDSGHVDHQISP